MLLGMSGFSTLCPTYSTWGCVLLVFVSNSSPLPLITKILRELMMDVTNLGLLRTDEVDHAYSGRHFAYVMLHNPKAFDLSLKLQTAAQLIYVTAITVPKLCIMFLYLTIFTDHKTRFATWVTIGLALLFWLSCMITYFTMCTQYQSPIMLHSFLPLMVIRKTRKVLLQRGASSSYRNPSMLRVGL